MKGEEKYWALHGSGIINIRVLIFQISTSAPLALITAMKKRHVIIRMDHFFAHVVVDTMEMV